MGSKCREVLGEVWGKCQVSVGGGEGIELNHYSMSNTQQRYKKN